MCVSVNFCFARITKIRMIPAQADSNNTIVGRTMGFSGRKEHKFPVRYFLPVFIKLPCSGTEDLVRPATRGTLEGLLCKRVSITFLVGIAFEGNLNYYQIDHQSTT